MTSYPRDLGVMGVLFHNGRDYAHAYLSGLGWNLRKFELTDNEREQHGGKIQTTIYHITKVAVKYT